MADTQYLFWVMTGTLTILSLFIGAIVGQAKSRRLGMMTFTGLWLFFMLAMLLISR